MVSRVSVTSFVAMWSSNVENCFDEIMSSLFDCVCGSTMIGGEGDRKKASAHRPEHHSIEWMDCGSRKLGPEPRPANPFPFLPVSSFLCVFVHSAFWYDSANLCLPLMQDGRKFLVARAREYSFLS